MLNPATKRSRILTGQEGVAPNGNVTIPIETGKVYDSFVVYYYDEGVLASVTAGITRVKLVVDGKTKLDLAPDKVIDLAKIDGHAVAVGELPLFYSEPSRASVADEEFTVLDLLNAGSAHIELKIAADAVSPQIVPLGMFSLKPSARNAEGMQFIPVRESYNFVTGGAGIFDITTLPKGKDISRIMLYHPSGISQVEVTVDGDIQNELTLAMYLAQLEKYGLTPDATDIDFPLIFNIDQKASSVIRATRELRLRCTVGGAGTLVAVVETIEQML